MEPQRNSGTITFDRRLIYRPFLERLNPIASPRYLIEEELIILRDHDPRDFEQPPIHVALARAAELTHGVQIAVVGGVGSGKTIELHLTERILKRHADSINLYLDLADITDLNHLNTASILIAIGMNLFKRLKKIERTDEIRQANQKLSELAFGKTEYVSREEFEGPEDYDSDDYLRVNTGLLKPRFPALQHQVMEVRKLLGIIIAPLQKREAQITVLLDGLDRLIQPERFREFAEQDLRALRDTKISIIVAAPLLLWYDKSRFLHDYFDEVKHIPAMISGASPSDFLTEILERRGALDLMDREELNSIIRFSGGVLRDLLTLARSSAEYAYGEGMDRVEQKHVQAAVRQLGKRYLAGLGNRLRFLLKRLMKEEEFPIESPASRDLLANRQVLEYVDDGREFFAVHPAIVEMLG